MTETFVDPLAALLAETAVDPIEALVAQGGAAMMAREERGIAAQALLAEHAQKIVVAMSRTKAITLASIKSWTFGTDIIDAVWDAQQIAVTDKDSQTRAWELIKTLKAERRAITKFYKDMRDGYNAVSAGVCDMDDRDATFVTDAEQRLDRLLNEYDLAEAAREATARAAEQARLDDEARQEKARQAEAARAVAAQYPEGSPVQEALLTEATSIAQSTSIARRATVDSNRAQVRGVGFGAWRYYGEIVDAEKQKLLDDINAGKVGLDAIDVSAAWLKRVVDEHKDETGKIYPYITVTKKRGTRG